MANPGQYTGKKSNSSLLTIGGFVTIGLVVAYLYSNIFRLEVTLFSITNLEKAWGKRYIIAVIFSGLFTYLIFLGSAFFVTELINDFVEYQLNTR